jgi:hypothetical protein
MAAELPGGAVGREAIGNSTDIFEYSLVFQISLLTTAKFGRTALHECADALACVL